MFKNTSKNIKGLTVLYLFHILVYCNLFPTNRDNGYIDKETRIFGNLMENFTYDCIGNEAIINDCPRNSIACPSFNGFVRRTELTCKSKTLIFQ